MDCPTDDQLRCLAEAPRQAAVSTNTYDDVPRAKNGWSHWPVIVACLRSCVRPGQTN